MKKFWVLVLSLLYISFWIVGCSNSQNTLSDDESKIVEDAQGKVKIPKDPKRIADISGSSEELLILGHQPVATANTDSYDHKKPAPYIKDKLKNSKIVGFYMLNTIDIEGLLATNPDLIFINQRQMKIYDQLKKIAPVVVVKGNADQWRERFEHIGKVLGQEKEVSSWLKTYDAKAKKIGQKIKQQTHNQSYAVILADRKKNYLFGEAGLGEMIYTDLNLPKPKNIHDTKKNTFQETSLEGISKINSDHLILLQGEDQATKLKDSPVWKNLKSVKQGQVHELPRKPFYAQSYTPIGKKLLLDELEKLLIKKK